MLDHPTLDHLKALRVNAGVIFPKSAGVKFPTLAVSVVSR
jgi:hypothetical protein